MKSDVLSVSISMTGEELMSIRDAGGTEFFWQGDNSAYGEIESLICSLL